MENNNILKILGFSLKDGEYFKKYKNNYAITIKDMIVNYGSEIKVHRKNVLNLKSKYEYLVVLECVNQLLDIGYSPKDIELEKQYKFGLKFKSYADILIKKNNKTYLIIECKTFGKEYIRAKEHTIKDGDQSFSYLRQEPDVKIVSLYTSKIQNNKIIRNYDFIRTKTEWKKLSHEDSFKKWDKSFEKKGLLDNNSKPYATDRSNLTYKDLKNLNESEGGFIFNLFAEILRRNVISDKSNAFNKIFNLFLCKIVDEDKKYANPNSELDFQWKVDNDDPKSFLLRLEGLYSRGLKDYIDVVTFNFPDKLDEIKIKLSNNFCFKDVYNEETFHQNFNIVKQVVQLLQDYQINYSSKHQYVGDFFESLLNHGLKQESGQFFTPTVLARFISKCLPLKNIINKKNSNEEIFFFPYVIDYSSGAGHFLTEIMDELNSYFINFDPKTIKSGKKGREEFLSHKDNFLWAKEYIYGIEKDYRLAKTTKISSFLNGDGDANIFPCDGLDSFLKSKIYKKKLKNLEKNQNNSNFDVVVANPPFSVPSFQNTLQYGSEDFDLFKYLSEKSKEIECLFIERTKQLLSKNGVVGIIIPTSILINDSPLHKETRKILFKNFDLHSIVMLNSEAFMESSQSTCILFMSKKKEASSYETTDYINEFYADIKNSKDFNKVLDKLEHNQLGIFNFYREYEKFEDIEKSKIVGHIKKNEKEKIECFNWIKNKEIIIVNTDLKDNKKTKRLLGYEFRRRRGQEGIKIYKKDGQLSTGLFNENDIFDKTKINYYILKKFEGDIDYRKIENNLKSCIKIRKISDLVKFDDLKFNYKLIVKDPINLVSEFEQIKIKNLNKKTLNNLEIKILKGDSAPEDQYFINGTHQFIRAKDLNNIDDEGYIKIKTEDCLNDEALKNSYFKVFKSGTILFPTSGQAINTNNLGILKNDSFVVQHLTGIYINDEKIRLFIYDFLKYFGTSNLKEADQGYPTIKPSLINNLEIPIPNKDQKILLNKINEHLKKREIIFQEEKNLKKRTSLLNNLVIETCKISESDNEIK